MRNSNFGIGVLHVKTSKYGRIFGDVISLLAQVFIVSFDRACKDPIDYDPIRIYVSCMNFRSISLLIAEK